MWRPITKSHAPFTATEQTQQSALLPCSFGFFGLDRASHRVNEIIGCVSFRYVTVIVGLVAYFHCRLRASL